MNKILKYLLIAAVILISAYIAVVVYQYVVLDVTQRVRLGVSQGVGDGMGGALNPLTLPKKMFGGGHK
jgi:hypothetical protein